MLLSVASYGIYKGALLSHDVVKYLYIQCVINNAFIVYILFINRVLKYRIDTLCQINFINK